MKLLALAALLALTGCRGKRRSDDWGCAAFAAPVAVGRVRVGRELSGLAASRVHAGILYVHDDDGVDGMATVYAIDLRGQLRASLRLPRAQYDDLEAIAVGPCPAGTCVYLGNIGDNQGGRPDRTIHRFREPPLADAEVAYDTITFRYPGGGRDAEGLVVDSRGEIFVLTKQVSRAEIFHVPAGTGTVTAEQVGVLELESGELATDADLDASGRHLLVRTYGHLWRWRASEASWPALLGARRERLAVADEIQGEAAGWLERGYATVSEGNAPELHVASCR